MENDVMALATIDRLTADFKEHPGLPKVLYQMARIYESAENYEQAKTIHARVKQLYPGSLYGSRSELQTAKLE